MSYGSSISRVEAGVGRPAFTIEETKATSAVGAGVERPVSTTESGVGRPVSTTGEERTSVAIGARVRCPVSKMFVCVRVCVLYY